MVFIKGRFLHAGRQRLTSLFENALRLRAIERRRWRVVTKDGDFYDHLFCLSGSPAGEGESAAAFRGLRGHQRAAQFSARVESKRLAGNPENDIARRQYPVSWGTGVHHCDRNLPCLVRHQLAAKYPAARPRGAEIPVVTSLTGNGVAFG